VFGRARAAGAAADSQVRSAPIPAAQRWAGVIQRHPVSAALAAAAFILILAAPALAMKLSMPDESAQARGFGPGSDAPLIVVTKGHAARRARASEPAEAR
jgi:RND superfamily putative drug exporter